MIVEASVPVEVPVGVPVEAAMAIAVALPVNMQWQSNSCVRVCRGES